MTDKNLLNKISEATGLPDKLLLEELESLVISAGVTPDEVTLEELRDVLSNYLQDVFLQAKEEFGA